MVSEHSATKCQRNLRFVGQFFCIFLDCTEMFQFNLGRFLFFTTECRRFSHGPQDADAYNECQESLNRIYPLNLAGLEDDTMYVCIYIYYMNIYRYHLIMMCTIYIYHIIL